MIKCGKTNLLKAKIIFVCTFLLLSINLSKGEDNNAISNTENQNRSRTKLFSITVNAGESASCNGNSANKVSNLANPSLNEAINGNVYSVLQNANKQNVPQSELYKIRSRSEDSDTRGENGGLLLKAGSSLSLSNDGRAQLIPSTSNAARILATVIAQKSTLLFTLQQDSIPLTQLSKITINKNGTSTLIPAGDSAYIDKNGNLHSQNVIIPNQLITAFNEIFEDASQKLLQQTINTPFESFSTGNPFTSGSLKTNNSSKSKSFIDTNFVPPKSLTPTSN